jgi:hypothetical protein
MSTHQPNPFAIEAALRIAKAYQSEIENLFVEDAELLQMASFPFAREISLTGKSRSLTSDTMKRELRYAFAGVQRQIEALARALDVPVRRRIVRDDPIRALEQACAENGPWNLVALADPFTPSSCDRFCQLLECVHGTTGLVIVGPKTKRATGRIVVAADELERLPGLVRTAERLADIDNSDISVLLMADDADTLALLDAQARLVLAEYDRATLGTAHLIQDPSAAAEVLRRSNAGFVLTRFGGLVVPFHGDLRALSTALECPLLLVR